MPPPDTPAASAPAVLTRGESPRDTPAPAAPLLRPRADGKWELAEDWEGIPAGFVTDGASVPRLFWRVLGAPVEARTIGAFVRHDYSYTTAAVKRKKADAMLYDDLRAAGMSRTRAFTYWLGVRLFGWLHYNDTKETEDK